MAAGKGSRMGTPKVLRRVNDGTSLLSHHLRALAAVDPAEILVVLGAGAHQAQSLIPEGVKTILNLDHAMAMGRSLQTGLRAVDPHSNVAVVTLVDLTDTPAEIYPRLIENATDGVLARCTWGSVPGHPVMFGRNWISRAIDACGGDSGAKRLFREASDSVTLIEGGDLLTPGANGPFDVDTPAQAAARGINLPERNDGRP
ncbi:nucleotidyltransferase family protein [Brevibacterium permense]